MGRGRISGQNSWASDNSERRAFSLHYSSGGTITGKSTDEQQIFGKIHPSGPLSTFVEVIGITDANQSIRDEIWTNFGDLFDFNRWWDLVEQSLGILQKYLQIVPFYSNFDQGRGYHISADGGKILDAPWNNISSQSFQEVSYSGGGNITFKGTLVGDAYFNGRLFQEELVFGDSPVYFTYSVRSDGSSLIGLALEFISAVGEKHSALLGSHGNARTLRMMNRVLRMEFKFIASITLFI